MKTNYAYFACLALLSLFVTKQVDADVCFHIVLPKGNVEFREPASLKFTDIPAGDSGTQSGFNIYHGGQNLSLSGPGCFILEQDVARYVGRWGRFLGEPGGKGPLIELFGSDIKLDLNGHALRSDRAGTAIAAGVWGILQEPRRRNYTFRNGTIDVGGSGISMTGWQYGGEMHNYRPGPHQINRAIRWFGPNFRQFGDTNILLENLTIKSGDLAVYLVGRNNIIRHCHIEVTGHEAVALFGANNQLVDNEIVVKRSLSAPKAEDNSKPELGTYYSEYAAIWIRDAPGLVIRGNKIVIEGWFNAKEAIMLINSPGVVIEDNEITGANKLYTALDAQSSAHARNNRNRNGKWPEN